MLKKNLRVLLTLTLAAVLFSTASAQEEEEKSSEQYEPAANSKVTSARLPAGALRIAPSSVPVEVSEGLEKILEAGEGRLVEGDAEFIAWTGADYTKTKSEDLMTQIAGSLSAGGWKYKVGGTRGNMTFFTALAENPKRRAVVGFFVATEEGLLLAWMEVRQAKTAE